MPFIIGFVVVFLVMLLFRNRKTRLCRWRETRSGDESTWRCIYCGAETTGARGEEPKLCLREHD